MNTAERYEAIHYLTDNQKHNLLFVLTGWLKNSDESGRKEMHAAIEYFFRVYLTDGERLEHEQNAQKQASEF